MAQKTNLNVSPYYDDFDYQKGFLKVLFKPGYPVQARELTTLQSILQDQIETFGSYFFKEGSEVIPGGTTYDDRWYAVKLNNTQFGTDISLYIDSFLGKTITGQSSNISARIQKIVSPDESSEVDYITLYVKYTNSNSNFEFSEFFDGEELTCNENIVYGNTTISNGTPFATTISTNATSVGSAASIDDGFYFVRGYFVQVKKQSIILDYYTNTPNYRVGLKVVESIIKAKDDESLYDNAKGFSNYASPGADRITIDLILTKKDLDDYDDTDFIELMRIKNGKREIISVKNETTRFRDYLAERTYDESGNYSLEPFKLSLQDSLNDNLGNNGLFFSNELTNDRNKPSDDLACLSISSGKAYVRGYDVSKSFTTIVDIEKPRDTEKREPLTVSSDFGILLRVNNVIGMPKIREVVEVYSQLGSLGSKIGEARVYSFNLTDSQYSGESTNWDLRLYDLQTYTKLTLNQSVSSTDIKASYFVKGSSSGATGFVVEDGSSEVIYLRQVSGSFAKGESLIVNGINFQRSISEVVNYSSRDIKSVKQISPFGFSDFVADSFLERESIGSFQVKISGISTFTGIATVTSPGNIFNNIFIDDIIRYQRDDSSSEIFNRVSYISADKSYFEISGISTVNGVFDGSLGISTIQTNIAFGIPYLRGNESLVVVLPDSNISSVDLGDSSLTLVEQVEGKNVDSNGQITVNTSDLSGISNLSWSTFDQERYGIGYSGGQLATITNDTFDLVGNTINFKGLDDSLSNNDTVVNVTPIKTNIQSKVKSYKRSTTLLVDKSKYSYSGSTVDLSNQDGLVYNTYYGLRVQDEEISLNHPDVSRVLKVYESLNSSDPSLDLIEFSAFTNVGTNAIIGENIFGNDSKAVARIVTNNTTTPSSGNVNKLGVVYFTKEKFRPGETVRFEESSIETNIESITLGSYKDISQNFSLDKGQKRQYYDYSKLVRNSQGSEPSKKLLIVFDQYIVPSGSSGDLFTAASYDSNRFSSDIPLIENIRATDVLDFRPRVAEFTDTDKSPFDFSARSSSFSTSLSTILSADEGITISYEYYLPRIDNVYLDFYGNFLIEKGISALNPQPPEVISDKVMKLASIVYPAYLYNVNDAFITLEDNKRYTMRDIGSIEDRVNNLEQVTSLSLLELNTQSLQIKDFDGRDRFKNGFFVDNFSDTSRINPSSTVGLDESFNIMSCGVYVETLPMVLAPSEETTEEQYDFEENYNLLDSNVQKTGSLVTLKYSEKDWLEQPFATTPVNVNPFNVVIYEGVVRLSPESDTWERTVLVSTRRTTQFVTSGTFSDVLRSLNSGEFTPRNQVVITPNTRRTTRGRRANLTPINNRIITEAERLFNSAIELTNSGIPTQNTQSSIDISAQDTVLRTGEEQYMRSRNVSYQASNLKPFTRFYQYLDSSSQVDFIPKLLEISNSSNLVEYGSIGTFQVGEIVDGFIGSRRVITFRICTPNHKQGSISNPDDRYIENPYDRGEILQSTYSETSKILNVDCEALSRQSQGLFNGYIERGMRLIGRTSQTEAYVKDLRLISDSFGDLHGSFFLRQDPNARPFPAVRIETGTKEFTLSSSADSSLRISIRREGGDLINTSYATTPFTSNGRFSEIARTITSIRVPPPPPPPPPSPPAPRPPADPLAQTFIVGGNIRVPSDIDLTDDAQGVYITSVDLFFNQIDRENAPLIVEIRTVELGIPTLQVIGKPAIVRPRSVDGNGNIITNINVSESGDVPTNIKFPEPIWLEPGREYALVIISELSDDYEVWTAIMGEKTAETRNLPDVESKRHTRQWALGSLYKSQNGSIWTTDQYQDLKFKLYKADFTSSSGTAYFYNPSLNIDSTNTSRLLNNPITTVEKKGTIGISTVSDSSIIGILTVGRKLAGSSENNANAIIESVGGPVLGLTTTNSGENYPINLSSRVVSTTPINSLGQNLKLVIDTNSSGVIVSAAISSTDSGNGYMVGDTIGIVTSTTSDTSATGRNAVFTITDAGVNSIDRLYLTSVQGTFGGSGSGADFPVGAAVSYYNGSSIVSLATTTITFSESEGGIFDGKHLKVDQINHGMYSSTNKVVLSNIDTDQPKAVLTNLLEKDNTTFINVSDSSIFETFEGQTVSGTYPGYVKIENEIIRYTNASSGTLTIDPAGGRSMLNTVATEHSSGAEVEKYEISGVSLARILNVNLDVLGTENLLDSYYVSVDMGSTYGNNREDSGSTVGTPELSFNNTGVVGGNDVLATKNIIFGSVVPRFSARTPENTSLSARIRTVTSTSVDGSENSFEDSGYENISLSGSNQLSSLRMVCSQPNEDQYLQNLPRKKSLTTAITLNSTNRNLSPALHLDVSSSMVLIGNRIDSPISFNEYSTDRRVNSITDDPHSSIYYSNLVSLTNPASNLKVLLTANVPSFTDFRVLYSLVKDNSSNETEPIFELFPGYDNLQVTTNGILPVDLSKNSGLPDYFVQTERTGEFSEYEFTAENLELFTGFIIKIVMSSTSQAVSPQFRDIRAIATR